jgi:drug/metabolite transporter (DMT)-like permease
MRGIILMVLSTVAFSGMHALIRYVSVDVHPFQIAFFRSFFGLIVFAPWIIRHGLGVFATNRLPMHVLRSAINVVAMFMFFTALSLTPIARVTALGFTAPIFAALMSVVLLNERFRLRRWAALMCGFVGTLVILRPGVLVIDLGSLLVLGSALIWGLTLIVIKMLARTESSVTITAYMNVLFTVFTFAPTLFVWSTPGLEIWLWLVVIGISGTLAQVALAEALKLSEASTVMPFDFLKLIWAAFLGYLMFAETVDLFTWVGAAIVVGSTIYLAYREAQVGRETVLTQSNGRPT